MRLMAGLLFELGLDCYLAARWDRPEVEELYRRLVRVSQALQVSIFELRDALILALTKAEGMHQSPR
jgi:hypothetical protein